MSAVAATLTPRKSPVQARSAATIETLHIAAIQVLTQEGLSRCTTTRIAERAGMSVGSLYQYYPNRDALLSAILEKHLEGVAAPSSALATNIAANRILRWPQPSPSGILAVKLRDPEKSKALYAVAEERGGAVLVDRLRTRIVAAVAAMLASAPGARFDDPVLAATIALGALVGPVQILLEGHAPVEFGARLERELALLLTAYFQTHRFRPGSPANPPAITRSHRKSRDAVS